MRKYAYILLMIFLSSCFTSGNDDVTFTWVIRNTTKRDITIRLMEKESIWMGNYHSIITRKKATRAFQMITNTHTKETTDIFNVYWKMQQSLDNNIQCEIWDISNTQLLKRWTKDELDNGLADENKKHFFREKDWRCYDVYNQGDVTCFFDLTDEDLK